MSDLSHEPLLDMFIFETNQLLEQLEQHVINSERSGYDDADTVNEIFRIMHTIKGSSAMMSFDSISLIAHSVEDLFHLLRQTENIKKDRAGISDIVLECVDFIKAEVRVIEKGGSPDREVGPLIKKISVIVRNVKEANDTAVAIETTKEISYRATVYFEKDCGMESMRAFTLLHSLAGIAKVTHQIPENNDSDEIIRNNGYKIWFNSDRSFKAIHDFLSQTVFLEKFELLQEGNESIGKDEIQYDGAEEKNSVKPDSHSSSLHQSIISVNVSKLDKLMDLVGELVISEAMVTQNPELSGLAPDSFYKAARQHRKIISELQDIAMSIRMVPLSATFHKMNRIVRDMSKKLNKEVILEIVGEETEVDKNIIEHISDPIMHLIRNSIDHGLESPEERISKGKPERGTITLEAGNAGGDVLIIVRDDGKGLDREKILTKARNNGLINRPENELLDKEIYSYVFLPGFSTKDTATEFSGRGVGMDVVTKNIGAVGGNVSIDSKPGEGTVITLKIPLTLAIMDGMTISVGKSKYTIPTTSIRESFKPKEGDVFTDPDDNEMTMIRGECYPVVRLHELFSTQTETTEISEGIMVMVENDSKGFCIFADRLIGAQQVVVKAMPEYIRSFRKTKGLAGCTLLGDGSISLILDIAGLIG